MASGAPIQLREQQQELFSHDEVIEALRLARGIRSHAAHILGCDPETVRRYLRRHPKIREAVFEAEEYVLDRAEKHLYDYVEGKEPWAIRLLLMTKGRRRGYGRDLPGESPRDPESDAGSPESGERGRARWADAVARIAERIGSRVDH